MSRTFFHCKSGMLESKNKKKYIKAKKQKKT